MKESVKVFYHFVSVFILVSLFVVFVVVHMGNEVRGMGMGELPGSSTPTPVPVPLDTIASAAQGNPVRIAQDSGGNIYVSDFKSNSVFIYDSGLTIMNRIDGFDGPLGIAVDTKDHLYVGNAGRHNVEVFKLTKNHTVKNLKLVISDGIKQPTDIVVDQQGSIYIVDSKAKTVFVFDKHGKLAGEIGSDGEGEGAFVYPIDAVIEYLPGPGRFSGEIYVADQGQSLIHVFDLEGIFLRSLGGEIPAWSQDWQGLFTRLQSLAIDSYGRLHAADIYLNKVQILDPVAGTFIDSYGYFGNAPGELYLPMDLSITSNNNVIVSNSRNHRVEIFKLGL